MNEISKEITLEDRLKFFEVEVKDYFEYDYKNENGNEDTREACLIRGGYRIALQAKECINHQKAENERLKAENKTIRYCYEQEKFYNDTLAESCEKNCKHFNMTTRAEAIKEFAERLKRTSIGLEIGDDKKFKMTEEEK